jgi:hypothetical protein
LCHDAIFFVAATQYFAPQSLSFLQAKTAQDSDPLDASDEGEFIAAGSSCMWMQR